MPRYRVLIYDSFEGDGADRDRDEAIVIGDDECVAVDMVSERYPNAGFGYWAMEEEEEE